MNGLTTVFRKEVRENLRDRRALFNSLLLGPLLFPVLFVGLMWFLDSAEQERAEKTLELPVVGAQFAPSLIRFLEQQGAVIQPDPENPEDMVRNQEVPVVIRILPEFAENWEQGIPAPIEVISDISRQESNVPIRRVKRLLLGYGQQIGSLRLQLRGVAPQLASPIMLKDVDLSTPKSRAILAIIFLPYVLMITAFTGATHLAMDADQPGAPLADHDRQNAHDHGIRHGFSYPDTGRIQNRAAPHAGRRFWHGPHAGSRNLAEDPGRDFPCGYSGCGAAHLARCFCQVLP